MPWSIKDEVSNASPAGTYKMRIESIEAATAKSSGEPMLTFKTTIVSGDLEGKKKTYFRSLKSTALVFIAKDIAAAQLFELDSEEARNMPSDPSELARLLDDRMSGKVFMFENEPSESNGQKRDNWTLAGPVGSI